MNCYEEVPQVICFLYLFSIHPPSFHLTSCMNKTSAMLHYPDKIGIGSELNISLTQGILGQLSFQITALLMQTCPKLSINYLQGVQNKEMDYHILAKQKVFKKINKELWMGDNTKIYISVSSSDGYRLQLWDFNIVSWS